MYILQNQAMKLFAKNLYHKRFLSKYLDKDIHSKVIRKKFLDYFIKEHGHNFVRSSPVIPFYDSTVPFVNAGMNQFKGIFLGTNTSKYAKVANTQKCIRAGGKHNDLDVVGTDGYHHTFFEMMGNWSFGQCSKEESCKLAWNLLTEVYQINKNALYVTYFGGDKDLNLEPDLECRDIWKQIGVPDKRILPFGMKDNFWEMGLTGPCGPCTEIHFDHLGMQNRSQFVNKDMNDLIELWNVVFIEYNRDTHGKITPLPQKHVDTGMGFERLVAVLQKKISNYDTDIFTVLFNAIEKNCQDIPKYNGTFGENDWNHLNTGYRILADHARMVTASLADGMIPEQNQKLRQIIRRAFTVCETSFNKKSGLLKELSNYVIENLGCVYPEMEKQSKQIHQIIDYEEDLFNFLRTTASNEWTKITTATPSLLNLDIIEMPGLVQACKEILSQNVEEISPQYGYKLFDTYGLNKETIIKLSDALHLEFDQKGFDKEFERVKLRSKSNNALMNPVILDLMSFGPPTDMSHVYDYEKVNGSYVFKDLDVQILKIVEDGQFVENIRPHVECTLLLDKTNLYCESGGQMSDSGTIKFKIGDFEIQNIKNVDNRVLHKGVFKSKLNLNVGSVGVMKYEHRARFRNMQNHTATHLLNAVIKCAKGATCQKSSKVTNKYFNLDVAMFGNQLDISDLYKIESQMNEIIKQASPVSVNEVDSQCMLSLDQVTLIPGEVYPENGIRLVEIKGSDGFVSREPCCGTHVANTSDLEDFCIIYFKSLGRSTSSIYGVTGERSKLARKNAEELTKRIETLKKNIEDNIDKPDALEMAVASLREQLNYNIESDNLLPYIVKNECAEKLANLSKMIKDTARETLKEFVEMEMQDVIQTKKMKSESNKDFIVHYLKTSMILESVPLQRATKLCETVPVLVISCSNNVVKARCCVPQVCKSEIFNAESWLNVVGNIFNSKVAPPKGQDPTLVCNMKGKKICLSEWHDLLKDGLESAKFYASKHL